MLIRRGSCTPTMRMRTTLAWDVRGQRQGVALVSERSSTHDRAVVRLICAILLQAANGPTRTACAHKYFASVETGTVYSTFRRGLLNYYMRAAGLGQSIPALEYLVAPLGPNTDRCPLIALGCLLYLMRF